MPDYRLYLIKPDGHVEAALDIPCGSDEEAIALAEKHREGRPAEVWIGTRVVAKLLRDKVSGRA
jgi:hypothetical protein